MHVNYIIVETCSPDDAYNRAIAIGEQSATEYANRQGKKVRVLFRGLRSLDVIHDQLEHGCEIMFQEKLGITESALQKLIRSKDQLEVFRPIRHRAGKPDYSSKKIADAVQRKLSSGTKPA